MSESEMLWEFEKAVTYTISVGGAIIINTG